MTSHLPSDAMLASYASGTETPGIGLLVRTHLAIAPQTANRLHVMEDVGGHLLQQTAPAPMADDALSRTLAALDMPDAAPAPRADVGTVPEPLAQVLGKPLADLDWQFRLPGLHEYVLEGFSEGEEVSLLRARPGAGMLQHTHHGEEITLILTGEMTDGDIVLRRGDVSEADDHHDHRPRITGTEICYCLVVMTGKVHFTGPFSRALNLFT